MKKKELKDKKESKENDGTSLDENEKSSQKDPDVLKNAQIGYQAAITLWVHENDSMLSKFNAFLVANSIILLAAVNIVTKKSPSCSLWAFLALMSGIGIIFCVLWYLITKRSSEYVRYWTSSARMIEKNFLSPVSTVSQGKKFAEGKEVKFYYKTPHVFETLRMKFSARLLRIEWILYRIIVIFFVVYCILFTFSLCHVIHCYCC